MGNPEILELIGLIVGAVLTLIIFSYLLGDHILYRWVLALLVGCGAGYVMGMALRFLWWDWLEQARAAESPLLKIYYFIPLLLGILLLFKGFSSLKILGRLSALGNIPMAYLIGTGAAVTIAGALLGTLFPQIAATGKAMTLRDFPWGLLRGIAMLIGTISALLVFSARTKDRDGDVKPVMLWVRRFGEFFIIVALAAAFAGAITSGLTLWVERWAELFKTVFYFIRG
ncbi:MAG TPA: hypothetical protein PLJ78_13830 [Anaerolineae bacterium]|nr:hypothetical protein [Anaerolineae bacterium]HQK15010.1 hypothetical protein [Anaerolineae bacterium]